MHILFKKKTNNSVSTSFEHDRTSQLVPCVCQTVTRRHRVWLGCLVELKAPLRGEGLLFLPNPPLGRLGLNPAVVGANSSTARVRLAWRCDQSSARRAVSPGADLL